MRRHFFYLLFCTMLAGLATAGRAIAADSLEKYFIEQCVECHKVKENPIDQKRLTRKEWADALEKMLELDKLDPVPSKQFMSDMLEWLVKNRGPVDGSSATAQPPSTAPDADKH